jgi:FkbM family methyltransferase
MKSNLVYDIGMHVGQDTAYYLRKGYDVIAVEANPVLAEQNKKKFSKAISEGRLIILNIGISDKEGTLPFYVNKRLSEWSSFDKATGTRNNTPFEIIEVPCMTTAQIFRQYGVPFYLKVDIEGFDHYCLLDIDEHSDKPQFVSCEAVHVEWLDILYNKGYRKFKLLHQGYGFRPIDLELEKKKWFPKYQIISNGIKLRLQKFILFKHAYGSSGPFGDDTKGEWKTYEELRGLYLSFYQHEKKSPLNPVSWFDFHASL